MSEVSKVFPLPFFLLVVNLFGVREGSLSLRNALGVPTSFPKSSRSRSFESMEKRLEVEIVVNLQQAGAGEGVSRSH